MMYMKKRFLNYIAKVGKHLNSIYKYTRPFYDCVVIIKRLENGHKYKYLLWILK